MGRNRGVCLNQIKPSLVSESITVKVKFCARDMEVLEVLAIAENLLIRDLVKKFVMEEIKEHRQAQVALLPRM